MSSPQPAPREPNPTSHPQPARPVAPPRTTKTKPRVSGVTPEERIRNGRIGAHIRWANTDDRTAATAPARQAFADRWDKQVDPDGVLTPKERHLRAEHAKKAYFLQLAAKSAKARAKRKAA